MANKYKEILQYLVDKIEHKEYEKGAMLPTERELTSQFNVSRMTVRRAYDELIQEGYAFRKKDIGVFVTFDKRSRSSKKLSVRHDDSIVEEYGQIETQVLELKRIPATKTCMKYLSINKGEDVYVLRRVQKSRIPLLYEEIYLPVRYFYEFQIEECVQPINELVSKYKKFNSVQSVYQEIEAKIATKSISELLHVPISSPILQITNIVKDEEKVLYFGINSYDAYLFTFTTGE